MLRMIGTKLKEWIKGMKDRIHPGDGEGDVEIRGNLDIDGTTGVTAYYVHSNYYYNNEYDQLAYFAKSGPSGSLKVWYFPNQCNFNAAPTFVKGAAFGDVIKSTGVKLTLNGIRTIELIQNPRQPSITHEGNISESSMGSPAIGTYTLKYTPTYDISGNIVGGAGTLAINLTTAPTTKTLYLTSSKALPKLTGILNSAGVLVGVACDGDETGTDTYGFTLANLLEGVVATGTYEGGIAIARN